ncbi:MAG: FeoB-associated Cys-rich membrane protein [Clostridiales bacterium]|nr:FeoB-associated Cys-rich membrane protein [Clostridiales bacterium]
MGAWEILLIIACAGIVIAVSVTSIIKKKQGKHDCDCGGDCAHCSACQSATKKK